MIKTKRTVYLPKSIIDEIQKSADAQGYSWNTMLIMLLRDYYYEERVRLIDFMKGDK